MINAQPITPQSNSDQNANPAEESTTTQTSSTNAAGMPSKTMQRKRRSGRLKYIIGGLLVAVLLLGGGAGFYLTQQNQDVRQRAAVEEPGAGGCLGTQRSIKSGTCGGDATQGCTNDCSCGYSAGGCGNKSEGQACYSDGQCISGKCEGGSANNAGSCAASSQTQNPVCPAGTVQDQNQLDCNSVQYPQVQNVNGQIFCWRCVEASGIPAGQVCNQTKCICQGGPKNAQMVDNGTRCPLECWFANSATSCTATSITNAASCDSAVLTSNPSATLYPSQTACVNALNQTVTCFDVQNGCQGTTRQSCDNVRYFSQASQCLTASNTPGTSTNCTQSTVNKCLEEGKRCTYDPTRSIKYQLTADSSCSNVEVCKYKLGSEALYNSAVTACQSSPNNIWNNNSCTCNENPDWNCNSNNVNRCNTNNEKCTFDPDRTPKYQFKSHPDCGGASTDTGTGGTGGSTSTSAMCPNEDHDDKPIAKYLKFTCDNGCYLTTENGITDWRCYDNREESATPLTLAPGECGQVDALYGDSDATYCGYTQYTCGDPACQNSNATPPGDTPDYPDDPVGPMCMNITQSTQTPKIGEAMTFTCGEVAGTTLYRFRIFDPNGTRTVLKATGRTSEPFTPTMPGKYTAQCTVCTGEAGNRDCQPWEATNISSSNTVDEN